MKKAKFTQLSLMIVALVAIVVFAGCPATNPNDDVTAPTVVSTVPAADALEVTLNSSITATFSEAMNADTIVAANFTVTNDGVPVAGAVSYDAASKTATFDPTANLAASLPMVVTITADVEDVAGNALAAEYVWTFTTGTVVDGTAPTVSSTLPVSSGFMNIDGYITVTFSEPMLASSITAAGTFTVVDSLSANVVGVVTTPTTTTARFTPSAALDPEVVYTATVTVAATDAAGNALAVPKVWSFETRPLNPQAPPLGETDRLAIIANLSVTNSGPSVISGGDMMVMSNAASFFTGFTTLDELSGVFDELVGGKYGYASNTTDGIQPVPHASVAAFITQTSSDLTAADNFLALEPNPGAATQVCATQLGGLTLTRGVYKTAADVLISAGTGVTLDAQGDADSVWIFVISGTLETITQVSGNVILTNGALAQNVYWRTGGSTTIAADTFFRGKVFAAPLVAVGTNATVIGSLYSLTAQVTLLSNTITKP